MDAETRTEEARREGEARRRLILEAARIGEWDLDPETLEARGSPVHDRILGYDAPPPAWSYDAFLRHVHPEDRARVDRAFRRTLATFEDWDLECRIVRTDGEVRWIWVRGSVDRDPGGEPVRILGLVQDISERKRAEVTLRRSEEKYRALFASMDQGFCVLEMLLDEGGAPVDYRFLEMNPMFEELTGLRRSIGRTALELVPDLEPHWIERYGRVALTGEPIRFVEGSEAMDRWFDVYAFRLGGDDSLKVALLFTNITERKRAEAERDRLLKDLELERSRLATVFEQAPAAITTLRGPEHVFEMANPLYHRLVGRRGLIGKTVREALPEVAGQGFYELLDRVYETGEPFLGRGTRILIRTEPGSPPQERFLDFVYQPLRDADGSVSGIFVHAVDVTEHRRAVEALARAHEEMERRVEERTAELKALNTELESFNYSVSHDLRAPLRGIDGFGQALLEDYGDRLDDTGRHYLRRIRGGAERMGRLIDDLLNLSRLSRATGKRQRVDLSALAERAVETLRAQEPERRVEVVIQEGVTAIGDDGLLSVALENLLGNAWKFTRDREGARIEFGVRGGDGGEGGGEDGEAVLFVRDNGAGFDMRYADKLFAPFQRLHSPDAFSGTGIGLAIVQRILRRHGGRIWAEGEVGEGATFWFTLPRARREDERPAS